MYGIDFNVRVGVHWGETVVGSVGSPGHERLTAMGDVVNVASRVEASNTEAGTRFLITEALYDLVKDDVEVSHMFYGRELMSAGSPKLCS